MLLTPTEMERLTIFNAAELSRRRRARGLKLNYPEAVAIITDEILEGARDGRTVADMIGYGSTILSTDDVLPGVDVLMGTLQVEAFFDDGQKLVTVHSPVRPGREPVVGVDPGEIVTAEDPSPMVPGPGMSPFKVTKNVSSGSTTVSPLTVTGIEADEEPAANVTVPDLAT